MLITTREVATLLKVHPKHVYRLLKRGLPAHRVGDEWRFDEEEVRRFCRNRGTQMLPDRGSEGGAAESVPSVQPRSADKPPSFVAANGDVAVELLLAAVRLSCGPCLGHIPADHQTGLDLLRKDAVLVSGFHGEAMPSGFATAGLARIRLVEREVGLVFPRGSRLRRISAMVGHRLAGRPLSAGIRVHFDAALAKEGVESERVYKNALLLDSHRDVVMAVVRGEAEVGLASQAWAARAGLGFLALASESYGLILRGKNLGDPAIVGLCEVAQSAAFRKRLASETGYVPSRAGEIRLGTSP
jgi:putative molybdopterin biosynthesis protein